MLDTDIKQAHALADIISNKVEAYLASMKGQEAHNLYELVLAQVEEPLLDTVMGQVKYNQSQAALSLGISRGTLRAKLKKYFDDKYISTRG